MRAANESYALKMNIIVILDFVRIITTLSLHLKPLQKTSLGLYKRLIYEADKIKNRNADTVVKTTDTNQDALFTANRKG